jgi:hypothetical protein
MGSSVPNPDIFRPTWAYRVPSIPSRPAPHLFPLGQDNGRHTLVRAKTWVGADEVIE